MLANTNFKGRAPLAWAVQQGHLDIAELLLGAEADANQTCALGSGVLYVFLFLSLEEPRKDMRLTRLSLNASDPCIQKPKPERKETSPAPETLPTVDGQNPA